MNIKKDEELKEKVSIMSFANSYAKCTKQKRSHNSISKTLLFISFWDAL